MKENTFFKWLTFAGLTVLAGVALVTCSGCSPVDVKAAPAFSAHEAAASLQVPDGACSGTKYLPHTVLTAAHCLSEGLVSVDGKPAKVLYTLADKTDHVFVVTDLTFPGPFPTPRFTDGLLQGTVIHFYGDPLGIPDQYRLGYVTGNCKADYCFPGLSGVLGLPTDYPVALLSVMGQHGDSGAGIYNADDELVGVVSLVQQEMPPPFVPMGALPFTFTAGEIATVALMDGGAVAAMEPAP